MHVCYFGTYDRDYSRNRIIIEGLRENGVRVTECHVALWRGTKDKVDRVAGNWASPRFLVRALSRYARLLGKYGRVGAYDVMMVGYAGHLDMFPARILATMAGKPLVFDAYLSLYNTIVEDRQLVGRDSLKAKLVYRIERAACRMADMILLDTEQHIALFRRLYGLPADKFRRVWIGANDRIFRPLNPHRADDGPFKVLYFGKYVPLQGVQYIIEAAKLLEGHPDIRFELVGTGELKSDMQRLAAEMGVGNVVFTDWVPNQELPRRIAEADVCLGIFGTTDKARRVVPNKVYEALAMAKPVITGDSPAAREALVDGENALLCEMGNAQALAQAILLLKRDRALREKIAQGGYASFLQRFSPKAIGATVRGYLDELC